MRDLVAGVCIDVLVGDEACGRDIEEVGARLDCPRRHVGDVVGFETARCGVGRGETDEHGYVVADFLTNRPDDLQGQSDTVLQASTPLVGAGVRQRGEELVDEIPVGGMHLEDIEPDIHAWMDTKREPAGAAPFSGATEAARG